VEAQTDGGISDIGGEGRRRGGRRERRKEEWRVEAENDEGISHEDDDGG
jgi:hypothetical protein